jgi:methylmalonyl-CoA mutase C-terminal domain/subunit
MTLFPAIQDLLGAKGATHMLLTGGGIMTQVDIDALSKRGIGKLFGPGSPTGDAIAYIKEWCAANPRSV